MRPVRQFGAQFGDERRSLGAQVLVLAQQDAVPHGGQKAVQRVGRQIAQSEP